MIDPRLERRRLGDAKGPLYRGPLGLRCQLSQRRVASNRTHLLDHPRHLPGVGGVIEIESNAVGHQRSSAHVRKGEGPFCRQSDASTRGVGIDGLEAVMHQASGSRLVDGRIERFPRELGVSCSLLVTIGDGFGAFTHSYEPCEIEL